MTARRGHEHRGRITWMMVTVAAMMSAAIVMAQSFARDPDWIAPSSAAARPSPLADRTDVAAGGAKIFEQRCAACHGAAGRGTAKAPDLAEPDVQAQTDGALFWKIGSGNTRGGMPSFSFLPAPQRWQLVRHLRALAADAPGTR